MSHGWLGRAPACFRSLYRMYRRRAAGRAWPFRRPEKDRWEFDPKYAFAAGDSALPAPISGEGPKAHSFAKRRVSADFLWESGICRLSARVGGCL